jgi:hypothetical protein
LEVVVVLSSGSDGCGFAVDTCAEKILKWVI